MQENPHQETGQAKERGFLGLGWRQFGIVLGGILLCSALLLIYNSVQEYRQVIADAKKDVRNIAVSRLEQLDSWWNERQSDMRYVFDGQWHSDKLNLLLSDDSSSVSAVAPLVEWLAPKFGNSSYESVTVVKSDGTTIVSRPPGTNLSVNEAAHLLPRLGQIKSVSSFFTSDEHGVPSHVCFVLPFLASQAQGDTMTVGAAVFRISCSAKIIPRITGTVGALGRFVQYLVFDRANLVVLHNPDVPEEILISETSLKDILQGDSVNADSVYTKTSVRGAELLAVQGVGEDFPWPLLVTFDTRALAEFHQFEVRSTAIIFLLLFLLSGLGLFFVTYRDNQNAKRLELEYTIAQQKLETELRLIDAEYRMLFDRSLDAILVASPEGELLRANPSACRLFGYTEEQFRSIGREALFDHSSPSGRVAVETREREGSYRGLVTFKRADGSVFPADVSTTVVPTANGTRVHAIIRDVSNIVEAQYELERRQLHLVKSQNTGRIGSWEVDLATEEMFWSDNLYAMVGRNPKLGPMPLFETLRLFSISDKIEHLLNTHNGESSSDSIEGQSEYLASGQEQTVFRYTVAVIKDDDGKPRKLIGTVVNVTELAQAEYEIRSLVAHLISVREDERTAIARNIHDDLGQMLTALKIDLMNLSRQITGAPQSGKLEIMLNLVDSMIKTVKRMTAELRPGILDDLGVAAAIEWQLHQFTERTGVANQLDFIFPEKLLTKELSTTLFRITQEALTNVARHANAQRVAVEVFEDAGNIVLKISDDGVGIHQSDVQDFKSFGLLSIRERAEYFGGKAEFEKLNPHGTLVKVSLPIQ